jgi:ribosomal protein L3 glutamine methyltransferase
LIEKLLLKRSNMLDTNAPKTLDQNTVGATLERAEAQFETAELAYGHGTDNAFDDACVLLRHAMNLAYDADLTQERWEQTVPAAALEYFNTLVAQRVAKRVPTPYLTGMAYVQGVALYTDSAVIVPRSLLGELLFAADLDDWLHDEPLRILDLCTGSAAIAIQAAMAYRNARVDAVDIEPAAIALAKRNVALHHLDSRVNIYSGDLYAALPSDATENNANDAPSLPQYDIILSNPPYVNEASMQALPAEYLAEPRLALAGGLDGMDIVRRIVRQAAQHLLSNGVLVLEIGFEAAYFEAAYPTLPFVYLPVIAGDDLIVLIRAADLQGLGE